MPRHPALRSIAVLVGVALLYVVGVFVLQAGGITILVRNESDRILREVEVRAESRGPHRKLGDLARGTHRRTYVAPVTESSVNLYFNYAGTKRQTVLVGYAEKGYCGHATANVQPDGRVEVQERLDLMCLQSWFGFF